MRDGWSGWVRASIAFVALAIKPEAAVGADGFGVMVGKMGVEVDLISV